MVRMGGKEGPGTIAGNGNVSRKLLITINHRDTRVTNSRCRGITALRVYSTLQHLLLSRGNLRNIYLCSTFRPPSLLPALFPRPRFVFRFTFASLPRFLHHVKYIVPSFTVEKFPPFLRHSSDRHADARSRYRSVVESRGIIDVDDRTDIEDNSRKVLSSPS